MGLVGRPRKPTAQRKAEGNPGKRPLPVEPTPPLPPAADGGVVLPPLAATGHWTDGCKRAELWDEYAAILRPMGLLTTATAHALAQLCEAHAEYLELSEAVTLFGTTIESESARGFVRVTTNPNVSAAADAWRRVLAGHVQFGLTPVSLAKVGAKGNDDEDEFSKFDGPKIAGGERAS